MAQNYAELGKDALVELVKARRTAGRTVKVDLRANEEALRAALVSDDMDNVTAAPAEPTAPPLPPELSNQVAKQPEAPAQPTQPSADDFAKGFLARHKVDGLLYQVTKEQQSYKARVPAQDSGHPGFYWEGTEEEFTASFEKK